MKNKYLLVFLVAMGLGQQARGQGMAWRPFRLNLVYHFQNNTADSLYALKVDSAYAAGPDSIFTFNRVLRRQNGLYIKSRNNLFGARLVVNPANEFILEVQAEAGSAVYPVVPPLAAQSIRLKPRVAVGSSWVASAGISATLTSRMARVINGQPDSMAVITLSDGRVVELSRRYGLVAAPRLLVGAGAGRQMRLHQLPQSQALYTLPAAIYDFQPGDEFGYTDRSQITPAASCTAYLSLYRIISRQQTADSLIYRQYGQNVRLENDLAFCSGPYAVTYSATSLQRNAYALRPTPNSSYNTAGLLTYGYQKISSSALVVLFPTSSITTCGATRYSTPSLIMVGQGGTTTFAPLSDYPTISQLVTGLGNVRMGSNVLTYSYKHLAGSAITCGSGQPYATLLPTRAAQAARVATLHPNPASTLATLTLAAPAPAGTTLALTDALGRRCWSQPVAAGQTTLTIPVAGLPAGFYLVQLALPGQPTFTWKLGTE